MNSQWQHIESVGKNRKLYKNYRYPNTIWKIQSIKDIRKSTNLPLISPRDLVSKQKELQKVASDIFGDMYHQARLINTRLINNELFLVSAERAKSDIYPSESNDKTIDLCFEGFLGLDQKIDENLFGLLRRENKTKSLNPHPAIPKLQVINPNIFQIFLYKLHKYFKQGLALDLIGSDNVVYDSINSKIIINNSAVKNRQSLIKLILENELDISNQDYELFLFMSEVVGIIKLNIICEQLDIPRFMDFNDLEIERLHNTFDSYYKSV